MVSLGYEVEEESRSFEKEGLTGKVSKYTFENKEYPCITLVVDEKLGLPSYKMGVLTTMFVANNKVATAVNNSINIYISAGTTTVRAGKIKPAQVKTIVRLFEGYELVAQLSEERMLEGHYIYILAD